MNEHAEKLLEPAVDLIKQILRKHTVAVLEEVRDQVLERNARIATLESEVAALRAEVEGMREDAERWRTLPAFLEKHQINYVMLLDDIDLARKESSK